MNKTFDPFPRYPPAGLQQNNLNESTQICLNPPDKVPVTPQEIAHYRQSFKGRPGVTIPHYGSAKDSLPPQTHTYGLITGKSETVGQVLQSQRMQGVNGFLNNLQQAKYASYQKQPLGRGLQRNYKLPGQCNQQNFQYGKSTQGNQFSAKQTLCPDDKLIETDQIKKMYLKSHKSYEPGEQKNRQFNWNVNPTEFRFGKIQKNPINKQMNQVMQPESVADTFVQTRFVKTNYNDFVNFKDDKLGKPRNLGQNSDTLPPDFTYGIRLPTNQWGAGKCITGQASFKDVRDDDDLGKTNKIGCRNITRNGDQNRIFGVPSIRTDIAKPKNSSIANSMNYGQESTAIQLLFPPTFSQLGISEEDFLQRHDKQTIRSIFYNIGYDLDSLQFQQVHSLAKKNQNSTNGWVSSRAFLNALYSLGLQRPHHHHHH